MSSPIQPYALSPHIAKLHIADGVVQYDDQAERRHKVAICGAGGVRTMPWDDPTYECWAINNFWNVARDSAGRLAASRWWEQHRITPDSEGPHRMEDIQDPYDLRWIRECPVPLYTTEPMSENPRAVVWPIDSYARKYRDYFTCTFAMMIVQAYDEGFEELLVCGLELLRGTQREATVESSCVAYWLGFVEGRGMRVVLAPNHRVPYRRHGDDGRIGRLEPCQQWLLAHPYRYGHEYWLEADWVKEYLSRWNERPVAV